MMHTLECEGCGLTHDEETLERAAQVIKAAMEETDNEGDLWRPSDQEIRRVISRLIQKGFRIREVPA